jgi:hypothetical protein
MADNILTDEQIEEAKKRVLYGLGEAHHEHNDCVRIAYEWLDAQDTILSKQTRAFALKHLIEKWGGRYVSQSDVEVAAYLHPRIRGSYPYYNISSRLTLPADDRLDGIGEAFTHSNYREAHFAERYKNKE